MAAGLTRFSSRKLLDHILKTGAYTQPTTIYVALFTVAPTSQGGGTEANYTGYLRVLHNVWRAATDADPVVANNNGEIAFPAASSSNTIVACGLYDADAPGGNLLAWGAVSKQIDSGDTPKFADAVLQVRLNYTP
jgi:hypothetical protein